MGWGEDGGLPTAALGSLAVSWWWSLESFEDTESPKLCAAPVFNPSLWLAGALPSAFNAALFSALRGLFLVIAAAGTRTAAGKWDTGEGKEKIWGVRLKIKRRCHLLLSWYRQLRYREKPGCTAAGSQSCTPSQPRKRRTKTSLHLHCSTSCSPCSVTAVIVEQPFCCLAGKKLHPLPQG